MLTKTNYIILAVLLIVLCFVYYGFIAMFGFTDGWTRLQCFLFFIDTYLFITIPSFMALKFYQYTVDRDEKRAKREAQRIREEANNVRAGSVDAR